LSSITINCDTSKLYEIKEYYSKFIQSTANPHAAFFAKLDGCTITAYKSGKVLFQGSACEKYATKWGYESTTTTSVNPPSTPAKVIVSQGNLAGSDEVGTGDYFGPITVAACYLTNENIGQIAHLNIQDSKQLTDDKILKIAPELNKIVTYSLLILDNLKYNSLQKSGFNQGKLKAYLHNQALNHLLNKVAPVKPDRIIIDQFAAPPIYYNYLKTEKNIVRENVVFETKAENKYLAVACASIIARYAFLKEMDKLSEAAGFEIPKGAGAKVDEAAAKLIKKLGKDELHKFAKVHFANTEKALKKC
jgi:ribonuclease HIII